MTKTPGRACAAKEPRDRLVVLVTALGPPSELRFAVAQRHFGRKGGARSGSAGGLPASIQRISHQV
jgi:hypothetical protein